MQEIGPKVGGGHSFEGGCSFAKLWYNIKCFSYILPTLIFIDAIPKKVELGALKLLLRSCLGQKLPQVKPLETTETTETTEMSISQEHFFQLSTCKCDVSG